MIASATSAADAPRLSTDEMALLGQWRCCCPYVWPHTHTSRNSVWSLPPSPEQCTVVDTSCAVVCTAVSIAELKQLCHAGLVAIVQTCLLLPGPNLGLVMRISNPSKHGAALEGTLLVTVLQGSQSVCCTECQPNCPPQDHMCRRMAG